MFSSWVDRKWDFVWEEEDKSKKKMRCTVTDRSQKTSKKVRGRWVSGTEPDGGVTRNWSITLTRCTIVGVAIATERESERVREKVCLCLCLCLCGFVWREMNGWLKNKNALVQVLAHKWLDAINR